MANTFDIHVHIDYPERSAECVMYDATVLELVLDMRNYMRLGAKTALASLIFAMALFTQTNALSENLGMCAQ